MENLLIYGSIFDALDDLTNEEAGILFKALNAFRKGEEVEFEDRYLKGLWKGIKPNLDNVKANYDNKVKANQENGKKGGRPKKETITDTLPTPIEETIKEELKVSQIEEKPTKEELLNYCEDCSIEFNGNQSTIDEVVVGINSGLITTMLEVKVPFETRYKVKQKNKSEGFSIEKFFEEYKQENKLSYAKTALIENAILNGKITTKEDIINF